MKKILLFFLILWPFFAGSGQSTLETPFPEIRLGERLTLFLQKNTDAALKKEPSFLLPKDLSTTEMTEYHILRKTGNETNEKLICFFYKKKAAVLVCCYDMDAGQDILAFLRKKHGHYSSRTIYKGPDFNGSGCPTQEVTYWADKKQVLYFIYMPEYRRGQFILVDSDIQDRLRSEKNKAILKRLR